MEDFKNSSIFEYTFCEQELTPYEKTILTQIIAYAQEPIYNLSDKDINSISDFLKIDVMLMKKALAFLCPCCYQEKLIIKYGNDKTECSRIFDKTFIDAIIKIHYAYINLSSVSLGNTEQNIRENIELFRSILFYFDSLNANLATYECMLENRFTLEYTLFDSDEFSPLSIINMLEMLLISEDCLEYDKNIITIMTLLLKYEFYTRLNALLLVMICQIIKNSPYFDSIHDIAHEMYDNLLFILKNGRIISTQVNELFCEKNKEHDERSRADNTTRMQIIYGFPNFDSYVLRFDFSHEGQAFVHFNNESPGKNSCCLFNEKEYLSFIHEYPEISSCFISYGSRWALKEKNNCDLTKEQEVFYDEIVKHNSHKSVFKEEFSEDSIQCLIDVFINLLPYHCYAPIDKDGHYASECFCCDILLRNVYVLYLAYLGNDEEPVKMMIEDIAKKAYRYGFISYEEKESISSIEDIAIIASVVEDKIFKKSC